MTGRVVGRNHYDDADLAHIRSLIQLEAKPLNVSRIARALANEYPKHTYWRSLSFLQKNLRDRPDLFEAPPPDVLDDSEEEELDEEALSAFDAQYGAAPESTPSVPSLRPEHVCMLVDALVELLHSSHFEASDDAVHALESSDVPLSVWQELASKVPTRPEHMWQAYYERFRGMLWERALEQYVPQAPADVTPSPSPSSVHTPESTTHTPQSVRVGQRSGHHDAKVLARGGVHPEEPSPTVERHPALPPSRAERHRARALYEARVWELCADYGFASPRQLVPFMLRASGDVDACREYVRQYIEGLSHKYTLDVPTLIEMLETQRGDAKLLTRILDIQLRARRAAAHE